jgi:hypothetical protein
MNELQLFRQGFDTAEIANLTGQTEPEVCRKMHEARQAEHELERQRRNRRLYQQRWMQKYRAEMRELRARS